MTVRLEQGGRVYSLICASTPTHLILDEEEQAMFKEVGSEITFALYSIELEKKRERTEEALRGERGEVSDNPCKHRRWLP